MFSQKALVCSVILFCLILQIYSSPYKITDQIYMSIKIDENYVGQIVFGLFGEVVPRTVRNFKHIALHGINGKGYNGTNFLAAIRRVMILGGDIVYNNGSGSLSIYGPSFDDENFEITHDSNGLLAMANFGVPNSNGCMFFITTLSTPWLNGNNVVFGKLLKGHDVVHKIEYLKTDYNDKIVQNVQIIECGEIVTTPFYDDHKNYELSFWSWIKAGWFPLSWSFAILGFFHYFIRKLDVLEYEKLE
ncbi:peptidyl-prolyl cis-trans isomerase, rhodopsin-specific isozyme-like isoform X2 [Euwallacea fornicatus]|uniref:peptidyl-prolyl cis-trans isomerase, rhodopsin-specific isozyme-like isoform X2 n=1 Tax=Euwallacea fornicatus TaxID=995702 RepID=UPI00338E6538